MPYTVQEMIDENPNLVTVKAGDGVKHALARMMEHDLSQLPIVDADGKPDGMVTSDSILRAISIFGIGLDDLRIEHARVKAETFHVGENIFDLLDRLKEKNAVLIEDGEGCLKGIVTNYDAAEYFRRRAEDMMLMEDIESTLKDYIQAAYKDDDDEVDEARLAEAIQSIMSSGTEQRDKFKRALMNYLNLQYGKGAELNQELLEQVVKRHYQIEIRTKQFDDLTLNEYITLLLHKDGWEHYRPVFNMDRGALHRVLEKVRRTRNSLAHFRREISLEERDLLRGVNDWLSQREAMISEVFATAVMDEVETAVVVPDVVEETADEEEEAVEIVPTEDEAEPGESRYAPLAIWLQNQHPSKQLVKPTFKKIEEIIGGPLPPASYNHRSWWANDSVGQVQSQEWLDVGWRVSSISMTNEVVRFARIRERQKAYISFFSNLLTKMRKRYEFKDVKVAPNGTSWHLLETISVKGTDLATFGFAFSRGSGFRIDLYIDSGDQAINKGLFDALKAEQGEIEEALGRKLLWNRLDRKRASRIAVVFEDVKVMSLQSELVALQEEAIPATVDFEKVMRPLVRKEGAKVLRKMG